MSPYACLTCPSLRRALCVTPCTEAINARLAAVDAEIERRECFKPPVRKSAPLPHRPETMPRHKGRLQRSGPDDLR